MALDLTFSVHAQRKAIICRDTTPLFDELGAAAGWGTDFNFADYTIGGGGTASLTVVRKSYDGETETQTFDLTNSGFFEGVISQTSLVYNVVTSDSVMSIVSSSSFNANSYDEILDGLYTFTYNLDDGVGGTEEFTEIYLVSDNAQNVINLAALNLDDKILNSNVDLIQLLDIIVLEAMKFVSDNSDTTADEDIILNMLSLINNEQYEYYRE